MKFKSKQIDAGCRMRFIQDYKAEMGEYPPDGWSWDTAFIEKEKELDRKQLKEILKVIMEEQ